MSQQDYFSYQPATQADEPTSTKSTRPPLSAYSSSKMRIEAWEPMPETPPSCRTVSFSRWSRFTTSATSTPTGELKASKLCLNRGTSPTYNPPANEWTYLGTELQCGKPEAQRSRHRRQHSAQQYSQQSAGTCPSLSSTASTTTTSSTSATEPMDFRRRSVQRASTSSQLTQSFKASPIKGGREQPAGMLGLMARLGLDAAEGDELPSAFDSEDEDDGGVNLEDLRLRKSAMGSKPGGARYGDMGQ
ncbi:hypothetical protein SVAN01_08883 [Stagonosporopsis vannaccii]|nr:hypothetical protein SVAN01_08883 [Stagonosporopsis vannaccii]